jgi:hypothetical protein
MAEARFCSAVVFVEGSAKLCLHTTLKLADKGYLSSLKFTCLDLHL